MPNVTIKNSLDEINWLALAPGTTVYLPYRAEPHRSRIVICGSDLTLEGVPGPNGELPIIDGDGATTHPQFAVTYDPLETAGLITVYQTTAGEKAGKTSPSNITFKNLRVRGAYSTHKFTGAAGSAKTFDGFACGFYVLKCAGLKIINCTVEDCGTGIFTGDSQPVSDVWIEGNTIFNCGNVGSDHSHQTYIQSARATYRGNTYGAIRSGSFGGALKDRSSDVLIENNTIEACARVVDLSAWEGSSQAFRASAPNATRSIVRNNTFVNKTGAKFLYVEGRGDGDKVEWTNNTHILRRDQSQTYYTVFCHIEYSALAEARTNKNVFDFVPATVGAKAPDFRLYAGKGKLFVGDEWSNVKALKDGYDPATNLVTGWENIKVGPVLPVPAGYGATATPVSPPPAPHVTWVEEKRSRVESDDVAVDTVIYRRK